MSDSGDQNSQCSPSTSSDTNGEKPGPSIIQENGDPPNTPTSFRSILKPSQLSVASSSSAFVLSPSRLKAPHPSSGNVAASSSTQSANGDTPKFVPLVLTSTTCSGSSNVSNATSTNNMVKAEPSSSSSACISATENHKMTPSFVFGQNLQDRVAVSSSQPDNEPKPSTSECTSNGNQDEMLFSKAVAASSSDTPKRELKSLSESAREYEESRAAKRKYEEVEVRTGEEDEINIVNVICKLFAYDKVTGSWQERGRGTLRLNDLAKESHEESDTVTNSRLVFRAAGSLRVILNTKIWAEMTVERANEKSIRFTAFDANGDIRIFLVMCSIEDVRHLYGELQKRVQLQMASAVKNRLGACANDNNHSNVSSTTSETPNGIGDEESIV